MDVSTSSPGGVPEGDASNGRARRPAGDIERVAVIGAGVMGAGIAAHLANAGASVVLLDIVPPDRPAGAPRSVLAEQAVSRLLKSDPAAFMHRKRARLITPGNTEDHIGLLAEADWIIEAVIEKIDIKRAVYAQIDAARGPDSIVSSNTSTIPLSQLIENASKAFVRDFMITHFFNPPRYMRLLELVVGESTDPIKAEKIRAFADERLGKGVVDVHDTPGFVANRIGGFWVRCAISEATQAELTVEEADAVMGRPMGAPKTGVFGLIDLVGLDVSTYVARSLGENLPADDPFHSVNTESALMKRLIENGYTGRKGKGGFYRLDTSGGRRVKQAVDLATGEYHTASRPRLGCVEAAKRGGLRALVEFPDAGGAYAWRVLSSTLSYAASLVPDVAGDITAVDEAMRLGYNWKKGPFELIDELGVSWFARTLEDEGRPVPPLLATAVRVSEADGGRGEDGGAFYRVAEGGLQYLMTDGNYADVRRRPGVLMLADVKRRSDRLAGNSSASLWDLGDDVVCLEFHSKMNAYDDGTLKMFGSAIETIMTEGYKGLVLYSDGDNYSVGANIGLALFAANVGLWPAVEEMLDGGQQAYRFMKYAPFPVVGAPAGLALGGGCESLLHSDAIVAHAESYIGLPEAGLGLLPGWGGTKEMLLRHTRNEKRMKGPVPPIAGAFETISMAKVSRSAEEARDLLFLRPGDTIVMNRDRLLAEAKARVLELAESYEPPEEPVLHLPGPSGRAALDIFVGEFRNAGKASEHDAAVSHEIATVLTGGDTDITEEVSETDLLDLERECFIRLVRQPKSLARIEHMLETGKPLRN